MAQISPPCQTSHQRRVPPSSRPCICSRQVMFLNTFGPENVVCECACSASLAPNKWLQPRPWEPRAQCARLCMNCWEHARYRGSAWMTEWAKDTFPGRWLGAFGEVSLAPSTKEVHECGYLKRGIPPRSEAMVAPSRSSKYLAGREQCPGFCLRYSFSRLIHRRSYCSFRAAAWHPQKVVIHRIWLGVYLGLIWGLGII